MSSNVISPGCEKGMKKPSRNKLIGIHETPFGNNRHADIHLCLHVLNTTVRHIPTLPFYIHKHAPRETWLVYCFGRGAHCTRAVTVSPTPFALPFACCSRLRAPLHMKKIQFFDSINAEYKNVSNIQIATNKQTSNGLYNMVIRMEKSAIATTSLYLF